MASTLKDYVIEQVPSEDYYRWRFPRWNPRVRSNVTCVFHKNDRKPSLSINLRNGGAKCFAASCHKSIGNIVHFESQAAHITEEEAAQRIYSHFIRPIVASKKVADFAETLECDERAKSAFIRSTGLSASSISAFKIGLDERSRRYTIPIQNRFGDFVNIRFYRLKSQRKGNEVKLYSLVENKGKADERRYGQMELFPWANLRSYVTSKPLFLMASEKETMLAIQHGLQAIAVTTGEGSWLPEWTALFHGFDISVIFDQDKGGRAGTQKMVATLQSTAKSCEAITLPFPQNYVGDRDFDDWIISKNGNVFALLNLVKESRVHATAKSHIFSLEKTVSSDAAKLVAPELLDTKVRSLSEIRVNVGLLNHSIKTRGIVAGVSAKSFDIPWKFRLKIKNGEINYALPIGRELVSLVGASDSTIIDLLSTYSGTKVSEYKPIEFATISEVDLIPLAEVAGDDEGRYTVQRCFVVGLYIDSNVPYELSVVPTTLVGTQEKICIIHHAVETSRAIDTWTFSKKETVELETFQAEEGNVYEKLQSLATEIAANHTKIYARTDWHIVCLLTWFSPIGWLFPGETGTQRGWLNSLAIGDTQTGKSQVVATLQPLLKLGDIVNAENCTFVGLVGGAIKTGGGQMMLRWGRIPLCDRKLVVIEELSGLSVQEISNMSEVRSRGIARLDKGGLASQTYARTRLLALSNVRPIQKSLAQYLSGVKAIQDLVGHPEDISRFDLIVTLTDTEVPSDIINTPKDEITETTFTPSQLQRLCQFAWALKPNQIRFSDDAYTQCLEWTKKLQEIYHPSVPIFKAASGRLLLARLGAAIATLQFSWDGQVITVEAEHIDAAVTFIRSLYDKPSFGYLEYSAQMQDREKIKEKKQLEETVKRIFKKEILPSAFDSLIHSAKFTRDELAAIGSLQLHQADDLVGTFLRARVIRKGEANTWELTPAGKTWMEGYSK